MGISMLRGVKLTAWTATGLLALAVGCSRPAPQVVQAELPSDDQLCERLDNVIDFTCANRHPNTKDQAAWQIIHGALAYGRDLQIYHDGKLVGALDYLLGGGELRGWVLRKGDHGLEAVLEAGSKTGQGHEDQWVGYLSQCGLKEDESIIVAGQNYTVHDMITQAQWDIYDGMEATWTLMAFATYLPLDAEWVAKDGSKWNIERIVRMETAQSLDDSPCGGSHRMYAITIALNRYLAAGGKLTDNADGTWEKAHKKVRGCVDAVKSNQQPDGSLSTNFFARPSTSADLDRRISTTGHSLEFLMVALDDDEVSEPWVTRTVVHLVGCFEKTQKFDLECGGLYHSARGLALYRNRRFGPRNVVSPSEAAPPAVEAAEVKPAAVSPAAADEAPKTAGGAGQ